MSISLYDKYGGMETVSLVVHKFYKKIHSIEQNLTRKNTCQVN